MKLLAEADGDEMMAMVARAKSKRRSSEAPGYTALVERIVDTIYLCKTMCNEAHKLRDEEAMWEMQATIKHLERTKASLEKSRAV